jgi:hypothetical protein
MTGLTPARLLLWLSPVSAHNLSIARTHGVCKPSLQFGLFWPMQAKQVVLA